MAEEKRPKRVPRVLPVIGWREWIALPSLGVGQLKVKVDSGARTSSLHVSAIEQRGKKVYFLIHPFQHNTKLTVASSAVLKEYRYVKSSDGDRSYRPVIETPVRLGAFEFTIEVTLVNRDLMGFRMLLGREAVRKRFMIDCGKSYLLDSGVPNLRKKRRAK